MDRRIMSYGNGLNRHPKTSDGISLELYSKFSDGLKQIYALVPGVLEVLD